MTDTKKRINQILLKQIAEAVIKEDWELAEGLALMVAESKPFNCGNVTQPFMVQTLPHDLRVTCDRRGGFVLDGRTNGIESND